MEEKIKKANITNKSQKKKTVSVTSLTIVLSIKPEFTARRTIISGPLLIPATLKHTSVSRNISVVVDNEISVYVLQYADEFSCE